jgi:alkylhydroperoxidase/carboxymuconolactone decarboxylase family protein YurZ
MSGGSEFPPRQPSPQGQCWHREVLGEDALGETEPSLRGFRAFTVNHVFENVWSRSEAREGIEDPLPLKERRLVTLAILAAQGRTEQLMKHLRGAALAGITEAQLIELMIHVAHYGGWAAGSDGQKAVLKAFKALAGSQRSAEAEDRRILIAMNKQMVADEQSANVDRLAEVLHESLIFRRANGTLTNKTSFLAAVPQAAMAVTDREARQVEATVMGDAAVVTLTVTANVAEGGAAQRKAFNNIRFFARAHGRWMLTCWFNETLHSSTP